MTEADLERHYLNETYSSGHFGGTPVSDLQPSAISLPKDPAYSHRVGYLLHIVHPYFWVLVHFKRRRRGIFPSSVNDHETKLLKRWELDMMLSGISDHESTVTMVSCQRLGTRIHKYPVKILLLSFSYSNIFYQTQFHNKFFTTNTLQSNYPFRHLN